jgi:hypothetical protein
LFLRNVLNYCADRLKARGHLFLNEVLNEVGLPVTPQGQLVGWLYSEDGATWWEMQTSTETDDIVVKFHTHGVMYHKVGGDHSVRELTGMIVHAQDLSLSSRFKIDGPWGFKGLDGLEAPIHIFQRGTGEKVKIGKIVANTDKGLKFDVELQEEYKDIESAAFEVPMRFVVRPKKEES